MNRLQNLIHRIATDAHFRSQLQANDMAWLKDELTKEEQNALFSLRHLLHHTSEALCYQFDPIPPHVLWNVATDKLVPAPVSK